MTRSSAKDNFALAALIGSTSPIISAIVTSGVASFSKNLSLRCNHSMGVASPFSFITSLAYLEMGARGSSFISEPATTGIYSSSNCIINLANFVFAWPLSPSKLILCLERIALSNSGITLSSKPCIPSKAGMPSFIFRIRLSLSSSLILLGV